MSKEFRKYRSRARSILLGVILGAALLTLLTGRIDAFEGLWHVTRSIEFWELDDLLLAVAVASAVGLFVALRQISVLERRMTDLGTGGPPPVAKAKVSVKVSGLETIVRCTACQKFKSEDDVWQSEEDYIAHRCDATVVGGVCPACRSSGGK